MNVNKIFQYLIQYYLPLCDIILLGSFNSNAGPSRMLIQIVYARSTPFIVRPIIHRPKDREHIALQNYNHF